MGSRTLVLALSFLLIVPWAAAEAAGVQSAALVARPDSLSPLPPGAQDLGLEPGSFPIHIVVGLELRNRIALEEAIANQSDPKSGAFGEPMTQAAFDARFGPTPASESLVVDYLVAHGFAIDARFPNRLLVGARGTNDALASAFGIRVHKIAAAGEVGYASLAAPLLPADISAVSTGLIGLDNFSAPRPLAAIGANCCSFSPKDLATFYGRGSEDGTGQAIVIAGAYAYQTYDITSFDTEWSMPGLPSGSSQICTGASGSAGCAFSSSSSLEVSLDVEMVHGFAPNAKVLNYMAATTSWTDFATMYNRVVNDNAGHIVSTSWGSCEAGLSKSTMTTNDNIFANGNAVGETWLAASGDQGSDDCNDGGTSVDHPADSPHVVGVGGTTPTCSTGMVAAMPSCGGYRSETGWSGSGGGASSEFSKPTFQTGCGVPSDGARDVPDVSWEADPNQYGNYVVEGSSWYVVGGTSDAAPAWAAVIAMANQVQGGSGLGLAAHALYAVCGTAALHDITSGSNGAFSAKTGYDQVTGLGTPNVASLVSSFASRVQFTTPAAGANVSGLLQISGTANNTIAPITSVIVAIGGHAGQPASITGSGPSVTWCLTVNTTNYPNGANVIFANVTAANGAQGHAQEAITFWNPVHPVVDLAVRQFYSTGDLASGSSALRTYVLNVGYTNVGNVGSGPFQIRFEYEPSGGAVWHPIATVPAGNLAGGAYRTTSVMWSGPRVGTYVVRVTLDALNQTADVNRANNVARTSATWIAASPVAVDPSYPPA
ncbi:MAG: protease pro-enzyme activation domain-containing protein [Thermoplasmatota archaeon]